MFDVIIRQASLRFGSHCVFKDLNLTLKGGQWTCLLGGSGVDKTSLLRMIAGLPAGKTTGEVVCQDGFSVQMKIFGSLISLHPEINWNRTRISESLSVLSAAIFSKSFWADSSVGQIMSISSNEEQRF